MLFRSAFDGCSSLTSINVDSDNENYCSINGVLFSKDKKVLLAFPNGRSTICTVPSTVTLISENAFGGCGSLTDIDVDSDNKNYCSVDGVLFSKDKRILVAFLKNKSASYTVPNYVTIIGNSAFENYSNLVSIIISTSVKVIDEWAFEDCCSLTSVTISNGVTEIRGNAFRDCVSLSSITIPNSVTSIGDKVFLKCSSLMNIMLPNSVIKIGEYAFFKCSNLKSITIPNGITMIGRYTFSFCSSLVSVKIPNTVTSISETAFCFCENLTIKCQKDSYAHKYAMKERVKFELTT